MDELEDRDWAVHIVIHYYRWPGGGRRCRRGGPAAGCDERLNTSTGREARVITTSAPGSGTWPSAHGSGRAGPGSAGQYYNLIMRICPIRGLHPRVPPAAAEPQPLRPIRARRTAWRTRSVPAASLILPLRRAAATAAPNSGPARCVASWEQAGGTSCGCPANTGTRRPWNRNSCV
jgi:hypothetical protein